MAKIKVLISKKEARETIVSVSVICSDKAGTRNQNGMRVDKLNTEGRYVKQDELKRHPYIIDNFMLNTTAHIDYRDRQEEYIGSATECALLSYSKQFDYAQARNRADIARQIPFASQNKYMITIHITHNHYIVLSKGASEVILGQCK